jgi:hypothetical protein
VIQQLTAGLRLLGATAMWRTTGPGAGVQRYILALMALFYAGWPCRPPPTASAPRRPEVPPRTSASQAPASLLATAAPPFAPPKAPQRPSIYLGYSRGDRGPAHGDQLPATQCSRKPRKRNSIFGAGGHPRPANGTRGFLRETASLVVWVLGPGPAFMKGRPTNHHQPGDTLCNHVLVHPISDTRAPCPRACVPCLPSSINGLHGARRDGVPRSTAASGVSPRSTRAAGGDSPAGAYNRRPLAILADVVPASCPRTSEDEVPWTITPAVSALVLPLSTGSGNLRLSGGHRRTARREFNRPERSAGFAKANPRGRGTRDLSSLSLANR